MTINPGSRPRTPRKVVPGNLRTLGGRGPVNQRRRRLHGGSTGNTRSRSGDDRDFGDRSSRTGDGARRRQRDRSPRHRPGRADRSGVSHRIGQHRTPPVDRPAGPHHRRLRLNRVGRAAAVLSSPQRSTGESHHEPGIGGHSHHRHDAQPGGAGLRPDPGVSRRRRDQARGAQGRRCRAPQHARPAGQRQPVLSCCSTPTSAA